MCPIHTLQQTSEPVRIHIPTTRTRPRRHAHVEPRTTHAVPSVDEVGSIGSKVARPSGQGAEEGSPGREVAGRVVVELDPDKVEASLHGGERDRGIRTRALWGGREEVGFRGCGGLEEGAEGGD